MIGIPFANITSQELREKMAYMDSKVNAGRTSGSEYYENICMKSVNQCIGRAIRHRNDYACIVLMDVIIIYYYLDALSGTEDPIKTA